MVPPKNMSSPRLRVFVNDAINTYVYLAEQHRNRQVLLDLYRMLKETYSGCVGGEDI